VKYLFRAGLKDPTLQDLKKAEWYLRHYASRHATATMACTEQTLRVLRTEKEGSVLGDTLEALLLGRVNAALNRVVREIAAVAP
jgi:hypothetical protein